MLKNQIINLQNEAIGEILEAKNNISLEEIRIRFLGRLGKINDLTKEIPKLPIEQKAEEGKRLNEVKKNIEKVLRQALEKFEIKDSMDGWFDFTEPGVKPPQGHLHLITAAISEISNIFEKIGFSRVRYPEVEFDWFSFEGLNMSKNHPARDEWETYFIADLENKRFGKGLLTPHTSSGQLREMQRTKPPIRMINISKCYRRQSDVSHSPMFFQFEGLVVDKEISITHLKGTLDFFVKNFFGPDRKTRIRPFHFQFTEPSFEVDVSCGLCGGTTRLPNGNECHFCKQGWLEIGGSGIVHPTVLKNCGIDPEIYSGFAFGWGVERCLMMKSGLSIDDIRLLYTNDLKFLQQF